MSLSDMLLYFVCGVVSGAVGALVMLRICDRYNRAESMSASAASNAEAARSEAERMHAHAVALRASEEEHARRRVYEQKHGTPTQRAKAQQALHELAVDLDLRNGDGAMWSLEYPAPKETP